MTHYREAVRLLLANDATLTALATNGVWDFDRVMSQGFGTDGITQNVLMGSTGMVILPTVYLNWTSETPIYPIKARAKRAMFEVYFYDWDGYATIRQMRQRVYDLLHEQRVSFDEPANYYCRQIVAAGDVTNQKDAELGGACFERTRFEARLIPLISGV